MPPIFARKAFNDLGEYDFVKSKHAENLQDLLDRPYEDILVEEIIDSLPSRTVVEEMDVEDHPTPAPAPASETKQETKEEDTSVEVDASSVAKSLVFLLTRMLQWKALLWKRYPVGSRALAQGRQRRKAFLWERDPLDGPNRAQGSLR